MRSQAILNLPEKIGVTANLSLNYRAPTRADQAGFPFLWLDKPFIRKYSLLSSRRSSMM
jgi:hypothetical protein